MLSIHPLPHHDLLLILFFWLLFNYGSIWEIIPQERHKPQRTRKGSSQPTSEPKPFPGLTRKPVCQACEQEQHQPEQPPSLP